MGKNMNANDIREELYKKFKNTRGAGAAFCRHKGITQEWLRLVFIGEYEALDLLIEAADFLKTFKQDKEAQRVEKQSQLQEMVQALA